MNFHLEGQLVEIVIPFTDVNGQAVTPTDITATLYDGEDNLIMSFGAVVFDPAEVETKLVIYSSLNTLQGDELQEVRRLEVKITHAGGSFTRSHSYAIEAEQSLRIMQNSFMTYETALMQSQSFVNMTAFASDTEVRQRAALVEAFRRITKLSMVYSILDPENVVQDTYRLGVSTWHYINADAFQTQFPSHFKRALRAAQLAEADELLQGNVVAKKHAQGIVSETIGESSVTLRAGFSGVGSTGIGAAALAHLSGYIDRTVKIGRA